MLAPVYRNPDGDVGHRDVEPRDLPPQPRHLLLPVLRLLPLHQSQLSIADHQPIRAEYSPAPPS